MVLIDMEMPNKKNGAVLIIYPDGKCAFEDGKTYQAIPSADVVPWEWLERYADYFCAGVSMPEFVREAKMFYESTNKAMQGGVIGG